MFGITYYEVSIDESKDVYIYKAHQQPTYIN